MASREGDWECPACRSSVYGSKFRCRCGTLKPGAADSARPGDWICPGCNSLVYASRQNCKCGIQNPGNAQVSQLVSSSPYSTDPYGLGAKKRTIEETTTPYGAYNPYASLYSAQSFGATYSPYSSSVYSPYSTPYQQPQQSPYQQPQQYAFQQQTQQSDYQPQTTPTSAYSPTPPSSVYTPPYKYPASTPPSPYSGYPSPYGSSSMSPPLPHGWREGDWRCSSCGDHVYAMKSACRCGAPRPLEAGPIRGPTSHQLRQGWKEGDWSCPTCKDHVFAFKNKCRCGQPRPENDPSIYAPPPGASTAPQYSPYSQAPQSYSWRQGDWTCPDCSKHVYASRSQCKCGTKKPSDPDDPAFTQPDPSVLSAAVGGANRGWREGDWNCESCGSHVYSYRKACKCGTPKPSEEALKEKQSSYSQAKSQTEGGGEIEGEGENVPPEFFPFSPPSPTLPASESASLPLPASLDPSSLSPTGSLPPALAAAHAAYSQAYANYVATYGATLSQSLSASSATSTGSSSVTGSEGGIGDGGGETNETQQAGEAGEEEEGGEEDEDGGDSRGSRGRRRRKIFGEDEN